MGKHIIVIREGFWFQAWNKNFSKYSFQKYIYNEIYLQMLTLNSMSNTPWKQRPSAKMEWSILTHFLECYYRVHNLGVYCSLHFECFEQMNLKMLILESWPLRGIMDHRWVLQSELRWWFQLLALFLFGLHQMFHLGIKCHLNFDNSEFKGIKHFYDILLITVNLNPNPRCAGELLMSDLESESLSFAAYKHWTWSHV